MPRSPITCHVLDSSIGKPAAGVAVALIGPCRDSVDPHLQALASGYTDADGRCTSLLASDARELQKDDVYTIIFHTKNYFEETGRTCFYPKVEITFEIQNPKEHYHIPLLISPFGFTTYRGS